MASFTVVLKGIGQIGNYSQRNSRQLCVIADRSGCHSKGKGVCLTWESCSVKSAMELLSSSRLLASFVADVNAVVAIDAICARVSQDESP